MATHSSTLAWKIPWTEEPGRLQSMGSLGVGHDWATSLSLFTFMHWRRKWQPTPVFFPGESQGQEAWLAAVYGVAQSRTWLKWRRSSSSSVSSALQAGPLLAKPIWVIFKGLWVTFKKGLRKRARYQRRRKLKEPEEMLKIIIQEIFSKIRIWSYSLYT